ncbi:MAG: histidinol-phosphate transaminase [Gammaproteobacteria bacterium]
MNEPVSLLELAAPGVRGLQPYQPGKPLSELQREYGIRDAVKLASNENPLGPGKLALAALRDGLAELGRYPDGNGFALKAALAERHAVGIDQITLGNGSNDVLEFVARVFLRPGREAIFSEHAFAVYPIVTQAVGATAVMTPAMDYGYDLQAILDRINERTGVVFVANPNNPTGTWLAGAPLRAFLDQVPGHVAVVLDEAYFEYVQEPDYPDTTGWVRDYPNLVVTRTFSKAYGLAGLRVGYGISHPSVADLFNRVRQPFNVNALAQTAAEAALSDTEHLVESVRINREGMSQLTEAFARLGLDWIPSVANFVSVDMGRPAGALYEGLLREGVIVRPIAGYGLPNHLRATIGLPEENARLIAALERVLA